MDSGRCVHGFEEAVGGLSAGGFSVLQSGESPALRVRLRHFPQAKGRSGWADSSTTRRRLRFQRRPALELGLAEEMGANPLRKILSAIDLLDWPQDAEFEHPVSEIADALL
jgi:hypothetical protein